MKFYSWRVFGIVCGVQLTSYYWADGLISSLVRGPLLISLAWWAVMIFKIKGNRYGPYAFIALTLMSFGLYIVISTFYVPAEVP